MKEKDTFFSFMSEFHYNGNIKVKNLKLLFTTKVIEICSRAEFNYLHCVCVKIE